MTYLEHVGQRCFRRILRIRTASYFGHGNQAPDEGQTRLDTVAAAAAAAVTAATEAESGLLSSEHPLMSVSSRLIVWAYGHIHTRIQVRVLI